MQHFTHILMLSQARNEEILRQTRFASQVKEIQQGNHTTTAKLKTVVNRIFGL